MGYIVIKNSSNLTMTASLLHKHLLDYKLIHTMSNKSLVWQHLVKKGWGNGWNKCTYFFHVVCDALSTFASNAQWALSRNLSDLAPWHTSQRHPLGLIKGNLESNLQTCLSPMLGDVALRGSSSVTGFTLKHYCNSRTRWNR